MPVKHSVESQLDEQVVLDAQGLAVIVVSTDDNLNGTVFVEDFIQPAAAQALKFHGRIAAYPVCVRDDRSIHDRPPYANRPWTATIATAPEKLDG